MMRPELIVLLILLGIAVAVIVVNVNGARERARTGICLSNMRQVGLAIQSYESRSAKAVYPGYKMYLQYDDGSDYEAPQTVGAFTSPYPKEQIGKPVPISWFMELIPYLDAPRIDRISHPRPKPKSVSTNIYTYIELVICPSDPPNSQSPAPISYVVNTGMRDGQTPGQRDYRANGVFHDHYTDNPESPSGRVLADEMQRRIEKVSSAYIDHKGDGLQYTLMLSENIDAGSYLDTDERFLGFTWAIPANPVNTTTWSADPPANFRAINKDRKRISSEIEDSSLSRECQKDGKYEDDDAPYFYYARPSSNHPGGVNVVYCDAHGQFLSDKIDYYVYIMLMTPAGNDVQDPRTGEPIDLPGFNNAVGPPKFEEAWLKR